ncbi:MAG: hypothetical protein KY466_03905 [Gemmatimonadetes bacterium]|nr:hypothetical protein [Gemmatimonadota bacterium]
MREWKPRFVPLVLVSLLAAGCDGNGTDPGDVLADFNGTQVNQVMEASAAPLGPSAGANTILGSFFTSVLGGSGFDRESALSRLDDSRVQSFVRTASFRTQAHIPVELLGQTFVWSTTEARWVPDDSRTGAPADGVRVIWYVTDSFGDVSLPLSEHGYIDVRNMPTTTLDRVAVEAVRTVGGTLTVADYVYGYGYTDDDVDWTEMVVLEGTFTDGTSSVDVAMSLDDAGSWASGDETYSWSLFFDGPEGSYTWMLEGDWNGATATETGDFDVTVNREGVSTILALHFDGTDDGSGTLSHRGVVIANIDMVDDDFVLGNPAGGSFTAEQTTSLETVIANMIIYGPLLLFSLPFLYL